MAVQKEKVNNEDSKNDNNINDKIQDVVNKLDFLGESFGEIKEDIRKVGRQSAKEQYALEENTFVAKELKDNFLNIRKTIDNLLINQRQTNANLHRELEDWQKAAIAYIEAMERSIELLTSFTASEKQIIERQAVEKAVQTFLKLFQPLGLDIINPSSSDIFDDRLHEGQQEVEVETIPEGHIVTVVTWGYRINAQIIKRAKVTIAKSPKDLISDPLFSN